MGIADAQSMGSDQWAKMNISGFGTPNLARETLANFLEHYHPTPVVSTTRTFTQRGHCI